KPPEKIPVIDMQREMGKRLAKDLEDTVERHKGITELYYIKIIFRKHRTLPENHIHYQVVAPYFAKPLPDYDTSLFSMDNKKGDLQYHWSIPDEDSCRYILSNEAFLPSDERPLCEMIKKFSAGILV